MKRKQVSRLEYVGECWIPLQNYHGNHSFRQNTNLDWLFLLWNCGNLPTTVSKNKQIMHDDFWKLYTLKILTYGVLLYWL